MIVVVSSFTPLSQEEPVAAEDKQEESKPEEQPAAAGEDKPAEEDKPASTEDKPAEEKPAAEGEAAAEGGEVAVAAEEKPKKEKKQKKPKAEKQPKAVKAPKEAKPPTDYKSIKTGYVQKRGLFEMAPVGACINWCWCCFAGNNPFNRWPKLFMSLDDDGKSLKWWANENRGPRPDSSVLVKYVGLKSPLSPLELLWVCFLGSLRR